MNEIKRIIYGKDETTNIVNISIKDNDVYIFREINGKVVYKAEPYKHWVLSPKPYEKFIPLKGSQYFKYIKEYPVLSDFKQIKNSIYKNGLYSLSNYPEAYMMRNGHTYFKDMKVSDVSVLSFDIETTGLNPDADDAQVLLITNCFRKNGQLEKRTFNIENYYHQADMINDWCMWVCEVDPSLIIGHNIVLFDLPYIARQMEKANVPFHLGRHGEIVDIEDRIRELRKDGSQTYSYRRINVFGREVIDTFFLAIKADIARKYESYSLKAIIKHEGLEKPGRQHYDASKIRENWANLEERAKIIQYAEDDADDPIKLLDLMVAPFFYLTPHIPKQFQIMIESATGSQLNSLMVRSYLQDGFSVAKADEIDSFEGAVSLGCPGIYSDVLKVDVASLYPSIMRQYKIFPKTKDFNGNFLKALEYFTLERLKNKKLAKDTGDRYYKDLEQAQKVVINSAYGFMGASGLNYNYGQGAAEVTLRGRDVVKKSIIWSTGCNIDKVVKHIKNKGKENEEKEYEWIVTDKVAEGKGFTLVNADTDSISITNHKVLSSEEQKNLLDSLNAEFPEMIKFENDGYFNKVIVLRAKNYIMFDGKKIKSKGSSLKDQKKEPALREMIDRMINCLIHENPDNAIKVYNEYIKECIHISDIKRWATKKTVTKAVLNCATDPDARENERKPYEAIKDIKVQEGDKVYLYPAILDSKIETKQYKNGNTKEKIIKTTGLKRAEVWNKDHDVDKLIERVYSTAEILAPVLDMNNFIDYTLQKNKKLLVDFCKT